MKLSAAFIIFTYVLFCATCDMSQGLPTNNDEREDRVRRSPLPDPQAQNPQGRGNVGVDVQRQPGVGTVVRATGEANIYKSRNGNTRLDAQGHWSRVVGGPARGQRDHGVGIRFTHRF